MESQRTTSTIPWPVRKESGAWHASDPVPADQGTEVLHGGIALMRR